MKCESCDAEHDGTYGSGRFCGSKCARGFSTKKDREAINQKRSITNKERGVTFAKRGTTQLTRPEVRAKAEATRSKNVEKKVLFGPFSKLGNKSNWKKRILFDQGGVCVLCQSGQWWNGLPLKFHLDHINGDNSDNSQANLRMICPNCHSQTATYCGRNKRLKRIAAEMKMVPRVGIEPTTNLVLESSALPLS